MRPARARRRSAGAAISARGPASAPRSRSATSPAATPPAYDRMLSVLAGVLPDGLQGEHGHRDQPREERDGHNPEGQDAVVGKRAVLEEDDQTAGHAERCDPEAEVGRPAWIDGLRPPVTEDRHG